MANQYEIFLTDDSSSFSVYRGDDNNRYVISKMYKSELDEAIEMVKSFGVKCTIQVWHDAFYYDMYYFEKCEGK